MFRILYFCGFQFERAVYQKTLAFFLLFPLLFAANAGAQELLRTVVSVDFEISGNQFPENNPDRQIIRTLALNNGINLQQVKIIFQANVFIRIEQDTSLAQQTIFAKILNKVLSGDTYFRDFTVDSLLVPSRIIGEISLQEDEKLVIHFPIELRTNNTTTTVVLPDDVSFTGGQIQAQLKVESVSYRGRHQSFNDLVPWLIFIIPITKFSKN